MFCRKMFCRAPALARGPTCPWYGGCIFYRAHAMSRDRHGLPGAPQVTVLPPPRAPSWNGANGHHRPGVNPGYRVMMYSHDGFGLGHVRRNSVIASTLVEASPGSSVLLMAGCPSGMFFHPPPGVDVMKLPSMIKVDTGVWHPRTLHVSAEEVTRLRAGTVLAAAELFEPHLFLVDYAPAGLEGELVPTLKMLKERRELARIVLGLRDILDAPGVTRALWERYGVYDVIRTYYDDVLIYGHREIFDTAERYGLDGALAAKVKYCGYVSSDASHQPRNQMRAELQLTRRHLVLVTMGGGCDAYPMARASIEALKLLARSSVEAIIITGPLMPPRQRQALVRQARGAPVRVLTCVDDSVSYLNAADLVVSMAGYNTLLEAIRLRKPVLVIPRQGPSAEQRMRAEVFSRLGLVRTIRSSELAPARLAQAILASLGAAPVHTSPLGTNGLAEVVGHLVCALEARAGAAPVFTSDASGTSRLAGHP